MLLNNPFGDLITGEYNRREADLRDPEQVARYAIFQQFADNVVTEYLAFARRFGREQSTFSRIVDGFHGASLSFSSNYMSGFSQEQSKGLELLIPAICVCSRIDSDRLLASEVFAAYLGPVSGER